MTRALALLLAGVVGVAGCTGPYGPSGPYGATRGAGIPIEGDAVGPMDRSRAQYGYVENVRELHRDARGNWLPGALIGGVVGGVLGNQIGGGRGNDVATVAGVVGGAVIGGQVAGRLSQADRAFEVTVRLDDGTRAVIQQTDVSDLQPNMRVIVYSGRVTRY